MDDRSAIPRTLKEMWADKGCLFMGCLMLTLLFGSIYSLLAPLSSEEKAHQEREAKIETKKDIQRRATGGFTYRRFQLDGHTYLSFYMQTRDGDWNVVHDPDCPCGK